MLAVGLDLDAHDSRRAPDHERQILGPVVLEPVGDAEAVAQRRGEQPRPGGGADQREGRQLERHRAGARALTEDDWQAALLHRRVQRLLDRAIEAVDLVDEEHAAGLERGEEGGDVRLALERGAGRADDRRLHLRGDDVRERCLAEAGRAGEQHVVERLLAPPRRLDEDLELSGDLLLVDEVAQAARAQRAVEVLLPRRRARSPTRSGTSAADARVAPRRCGLDSTHAPRSSSFAGDASAARRRAAEIRSSALSPLAPLISSSASAGV